MNDIVFTDIKFEKFKTLTPPPEEKWIGVYRMSGRYNGPGPRNGERAMIVQETSVEAIDDAIVTKSFYDVCYEDLVQFVQDNPA